MQRSRPGHPQDNGGHERIHFDMLRELQSTPGRTLADEAGRCEHWRNTFNQIRPHESLADKRPAEIYRRSTHVYDGTTPVIEYPAEFEVRRIRSKGQIRWQRHDRFISESLTGWPVGIERLSGDRMRLWFVDIDLGETDTSFGTPLRPTAYAAYRSPRNLSPMS